MKMDLKEQLNDVEELKNKLLKLSKRDFPIAFFLGICVFIYGLLGCLLESQHTNAMNEISTIVLIGYLLLFGQIVHFGFLGIRVNRLFIEADDYPFQIVHHSIVLLFAIGDWIIFAFVRDEASALHVEYFNVVKTSLLVFLAFFGSGIAIIAVHNVIAWLWGPPCFERRPSRGFNPSNPGTGFDVDFMRTEDFGEFFEGKSLLLGMCEALGRRHSDGELDLKKDIRRAREIILQKNEGVSENVKISVLCLLQPGELQLMEVENYFEELKNAGIDVEHFPMRDKWVSQSLQNVIQLCSPSGPISQRLKNGQAVIIHCFGGKGRTGTIMGALLISLAGCRKVSEALKVIRARRPGCLKNRLQRYFLWNTINAIDKL
jgi:protein-tyrosine phosphatase